MVFPRRGRPQDPGRRNTDRLEPGFDGPGELDDAPATRRVWDEADEPIYALRADEALDEDEGYGPEFDAYEEDPYEGDDDAYEGDADADHSAPEDDDYSAYDDEESFAESARRDEEDRSYDAQRSPGEALEPYDRTDQDRAFQDRAFQDRASQDRASQDRAHQEQALRNGDLDDEEYAPAPAAPRPARAVEAAPRPPQSLRCLEIGRAMNPFEREAALQDPDAVAERVVFKLWSEGRIKGRAIEQARREAGPKLRLDQALTRLRLADPEPVAAALALEIDAPVADEQDFPDSPVAMDVLPKRFVTEALAVPLADDGETLALAMSDPLDDYALRAIAMKSRRRLLVMVACAKHIEREIERVYRGAPSEPEQAAPTATPSAAAPRPEPSGPAVLSSGALGFTRQVEARPGAATAAGRRDAASVRPERSAARPHADFRAGAAPIAAFAAPAGSDAAAEGLGAELREARGRALEDDAFSETDLSNRSFAGGSVAGGSYGDGSVSDDAVSDDEFDAEAYAEAYVNDGRARAPRAARRRRDEALGEHAQDQRARAESRLDGGSEIDEQAPDHGAGGSHHRDDDRTAAAAYDDMLDEAHFREAGDPPEPARRRAPPPPRERDEVKRPAFVRPHRVTLKDSIARDAEGRPLALARGGRAAEPSEPARETPRSAPARPHAVSRAAQAPAAARPVRQAAARSEPAQPASAAAPRGEAASGYAPGSIAAQVAAQVAELRAERARAGAPSERSGAAAARSGPLRFDEIRSHTAAVKAKAGPSRRKVLEDVRKALGESAVSAADPAPRRYQAATALRDRAARLAAAGAPTAAPSVTVPKPPSNRRPAGRPLGTQSSAISGLATSPSGRAALAEAMRAEDGLILLVGPSGSGKIGTARALADLRGGARAKPLRFDEPGAVLPQTEDFQVFWGEIRDAESAEAAARAAMGGALVIATLDAVNAAAAAPRLISYGLPPYALASALRVVISQSMEEEACTRCAQTGRSVSGEVCPECHGHGRIERTRIDEALVLEDATRALILAQAPEAAFRHAIKARAAALSGDAAPAPASAGETPSALSA